jgi:hypothetical protein
MPVMPVVPDELEQSGSNYIENEPEPPRTFPEPALPAAPARPMRPSKRVLPMMPVMPDELAQSGFDYIQRETEPIDTPQEYDIPDYQFSGSGEDRFTRKRRRNKLIRFIIFETLAFGLLLISAKLQVTQQYSENSLTFLYKVLMFAAAVAVVIIPVVFYGLPPTLPPTRR